MVKQIQTKYKKKNNINQLIQKLPKLTIENIPPKILSSYKFVSINDLKQIQKNYQTNNVIPEEIYVKTIGNIETVLSGKLWYTDATTQSKKFRIQIIIQNEIKQKIKTLFYDIAGSKLFNGITADQAFEMQEQESEKFQQMMKELQSNKKLFKSTSNIKLI